ncbi:cellulase family glycosylhydrolase [Paenibacillus sp. YYML68]|uniref:cellulase family glycosylhydrolase n=1 Tax=Paenibacillus sp. YYML68 TaxID=2909250 RepID=UPI00248FBC57|nr:cellulase family glycosylhydrolase [Paenibacillus sp. YYML68]
MLRLKRKATSVLVSGILAISLCFPFGVDKSSAASAVPYGQLKVEGSQLVGSDGQAVQLKGMSSHGVQWYGGYVNASSIKWLKDDWGSNVFRVALYTAEKGYITDPSLKEKVKEAVQAAIDNGLYIIIDWHILFDGDPNTYKSQAKAFFQEMATLYGEYPNVIYEIANEPNGVTWNHHVKPYAEEIITAIRAIDPDNVIIVGTPTWSQDVDHAANNPLSFSNIMYALHFYAGTHGQYLKDKLDYARNKGVAVFVSEWGTSEATGDGGPYLTQAQEWLDFLNARQISWVNWSLADKTESSAALMPGASMTGGWTTNQLSTSGQFVRAKIKESSVIAPAAPTGVSAAAGNGQATLTWQASIGATSYQVKRAVTSGGPYTTIGTVTGTSFTNTGLTNGTTYYYVVSAVNSAGVSANSSEVSVQPSSGSTGGGTGALVVHYRTADSSSSDNQLKPHFNIKNTGSTAVDLKNVKLRYYFTKDSASALSFHVDWAAVGSSLVKGAFVSASGTNTDTYLEVSFTGGTIPAGGQSGDIQIRVHKNDWSNFNEDNDYSYIGTQTSYASSSKVTLYENGTLAWGTQP